MNPYAAAATVVDPELPVVTIEELGILREVTQDAGRVVVTITPTYSGCPALEVIRADISAALRAAGYPDVEVRTELSPAWGTDQITEAGRAKLAAAGIAPPDLLTTSPGPLNTSPRLLTISPRCPHCGSPDTQRLSAFGSTACKALWRCRTCAEPFDAVKPL